MTSNSARVSRIAKNMLRNIARRKVVIAKRDAVKREEEIEAEKIAARK